MHKKASIVHLTQLLIIILQLFNNYCSAEESSDPTNNATFHNPIFDESWPDPFCYKHSDGYYYMARREDDRRGIGLFRSRKLSDWRNAEKQVIVHAPEGLMSLWAPELHFINGSFYVYFALDDGNNVNHRMYVSRALDSNNPMGNYTEPKRLIVPGDDFWAIDATLLDHEMGLFIIWSGWPTLNAEFPQNLYIAKLCDPERICSERVLLAEPIYSWERNGAALLEGPQILKNGNNTFLTYSASGSWTPDYNLGIMGLYSSQDDPMNVTNWWRKDQPVFWRNDEQRVFGVGHASFTKSPDGSEDWIVYHAMENPDAGWDGRTSRIERFYWNTEEDKLPVFPRPSGFQALINIPSGQVH